jgi:hypothetical protein
MFFAVLSINFTSADVILDLFFSPITHVSHLYNKAGTATVLCILQFVIFSNIIQNCLKNYVFYYYK